MVQMITEFHVNDDDIIYRRFFYVSISRWWIKMNDICQFHTSSKSRELKGERSNVSNYKRKENFFFSTDSQTTWASRLPKEINPIIFFLSVCNERTYLIWFDLILFDSEHEKEKQRVLCVCVRLCLLSANV